MASTRSSSTVRVTTFTTPTSTTASITIRATSTSRSTFQSLTSTIQTPTKPPGGSSTTSSHTSSSATIAATSGATQDFIQATLNTHNTARSKYGASPLTWNTGLYSATQQWANACVFQHSGGNYGENLAAAAPQGITAQQGVNMWMAEASQYNYSNPNFSSATGHFTQVVWKSTTSVACAIANCNFLGNGTGYLVCRYDPPGNYYGQFAQNVGRPSS
ncbi:CAP domain-containing protein [Lentinula aciculospora]|uniref:CAP domain-containing protein n=1 Tax=Lentinula aciculospora TaxID=153920 RepID=A0A9W9DR76_9AGAR|nr:CAP domain-containing protein [Lentinula aciculospora]